MIPKEKFLLHARDMYQTSPFNKSIHYVFFPSPSLSFPMDFRHITPTGNDIVCEPYFTFGSNLATIQILLLDDLRLIRRFHIFEAGCISDDVKTVELFVDDGMAEFGGGGGGYCQIFLPNCHFFLLVAFRNINNEYEKKNS